jgi:RNA polymerase sigma-70 factor (ECF subfamily)
MIEPDQLQKLYQYALALTHDASNAHDLLQTALLKWVQKGKPGEQPVAYIRQIIRHQFIDDCRRHKRVAFEPMEDHSPVIMSEDCLEKQYVDEALTEQLLGGLNNAEREVLFLSAVMEYSASEIAEELGTTRGTILSRIFRIKKKAQHFMSDVINDQSERAGKVS